MEGRLTEDKAHAIADAIRNDGTFCGTDEWLATHDIGRDEFETFLADACDYARVVENRSTYTGSVEVEVEMTFTTHKGKVGSEDETWAVFIPHKHTNRVLSVAEHGKVVARLTPSELAVTSPDQMEIEFDTETGEVY